MSVARVRVFTGQTRAFDSFDACSPPNGLFLPFDLRRQAPVSLPLLFSNGRLIIQPSLAVGCPSIRHDPRDAP